MAVAVREMPMASCQCRVLNVMSGALARDYLDGHLQSVGNDGIGRRIHRCEESGIEWVEEHRRSGYDDDTTVLRRLQR